MGLVGCPGPSLAMTTHYALLTMSQKHTVFREFCMEDVGMGLKEF